jgi:hypothetical protein
MVTRAEIDMAGDRKEQRVERLRRQLGALRSRIAILPQVAHAEFGPLVDDLETHLGEAGPEREGIRRMVEEIRAIDKCLRFELAVSLRDVTVIAPEGGSESQPCCWPVPSTAATRHDHRRRSESSARNA